MTPQERQLVTELFDRLATLEDAERDPEAERLIKDGLRQAPNAVYALVQTVLVQDEALKRAEARIRELEGALGGEPAGTQPPGFLDGMRDALFGRREASHPGSVPSVRPDDARGDPRWGAPPGYGAGAPPGAGAAGAPWQQQGGGGGSFLGTAAAAAAGVIGGSLMLDSIRSMMGHRQGLGAQGLGAQGLGAFDPGSASARDASSPWSGGGSDKLSRDAGLDDIGRGGAAGRSDNGQEPRHGLFDSADNTDDDAGDEQDFADADDDFDIGGDDSDTA
jgi:hypothetical protein